MFLFADAVFTVGDVGTWVLVFAVLLSVATSIKTLFTRERGKEYVTQEEFKKVEVEQAIYREKITNLLTSAITRAEFTETTKEFHRSLEAMNEKLSDLRVGTEQIYRGINYDVQASINKVLDRLEGSRPTSLNRDEIKHG